MSCRLAFLVAAALSSVPTLPACNAASFPVDGKSDQKAAEPKSERQSRNRSFSGCVDEQDGRYVLVEGRTLDRIAVLQAVDFPQEGFAKHLGHKVTVRGEWAPNGKDPLIKVRSIETLSDECAPAQPQK